MNLGTIQSQVIYIIVIVLIMILVIKLFFTSDTDSYKSKKKEGYVYVVSNIKSFKEEYYKIGMTTRKDPMVRIRELNTATPYPFFVHCFIKTKNPYGLEQKLHKKYNKYRVNPNREFFNVKESILVKDLHKKFPDIEFKKGPKK